MYIYIQRWMYSTCLEYLDYSRLVAATFRKTDIGRLLCCSVEDFSYVHGLWMSACLVCRCCVFMFWERRARLHHFGLGQSSLLISWIIWCDPSSPAVSRSVDGYQPQRCIYNIYIYIWEKGVSSIYETIPFYTHNDVLSFILYPSHWEHHINTKWMAQSPDSRPCSKEVFAYKVQVWKFVWFRLPDWGQWSKPW